MCVIDKQWIQMGTDLPLIKNEQVSLFTCRADFTIVLTMLQT